MASGQNHTPNHPDAPKANNLKERTKQMLRTKALLGLSAIIAMLAITATPALAEFQASGNTSQGPLTLIPNATFTAAPSDSPVICEALTGGQWHIQDSKTEQNPTSKGPHEGFSGQFTKCSAKVGGTLVPATVNATCELQIVQISTKTSEALGNVKKNCSITLGGCTITVAAGAPNEKLSKVTLEDSGTTLKIKSSVTGTTSTGNSTCTALGVATGKEGTFTAATEAANQKVV